MGLFEPCAWICILLRKLGAVEGCLYERNSESHTADRYDLFEITGNSLHSLGANSFKAERDELGTALCRGQLRGEGQPSRGLALRFHRQ